MNKTVPCLTDDLAQRLRGVFAAAEFTEERVTELLGVREMTAVSGTPVPVLLHRTNGGSALDDLVRLFVVNEPVPVPSAKKALWPTSLDEWIAARLLAVEDDSARSLVRLFPMREMLFMWDTPSFSDDDKVMGVAPSSLSLAGVTIRRRTSATLDLGTGCGVQGLLASRHSDRVTAIDRSPRAAAFTEQNAILNRVTNIDCLVGDRFEPVRGRRFDLIVSCPPFVVSPGVRLVYRDSGEELDGFCRKLIREVPALLNEGGYCQLLCEWIHPKGEDARARLASWFEGSGCDALILKVATRDAASYVTFWKNQHAQSKSADDHSFEEWSAYLEEQRIEAVSFGAIVMRRRSGAENWLRFEDAPKLVGQCGEAVAGEFERRDFLEAAQGDDDLASRHIQASPDLQMTQELALTEDGWAVTEAKICLTRGFAREGSVNVHLSRLIEQFYRPRRIDDVIHELAAGLGQPPASIRAGCLGAIRELVAEGMLVPAREPEAAAPPLK